MLAVHLTELISEPYKNFFTITLLILFALAIPLRASFRYVYNRLGLGRSQ